MSKGKAKFKMKKRATEFVGYAIRRNGRPQRGYPFRHPATGRTRRGLVDADEAAFLLARDMAQARRWIENGREIRRLEALFPTALNDVWEITACHRLK